MLDAFTENASVPTDVSLHEESTSTGVQVDTFERHTNLTNLHHKQQQKHFNELKDKIKLLAKENVHFCVENITTCDENAQLYTGLPNVAPFKALVYCFKPKASRMTC